MEILAKASLGLIMAGVMIALVLSGCQDKNTQQDNIVTRNLTVKTFADTASITGVSLGPDYVTGYEMGAEVDYPTGGPQPLIDSIRQLIVWELYNMFDWGETGADAQEMIHIPFEKVCEWKGDNIVTVFVNNYRPLYENEVIGVGANYLSLKLVAQTEMFVTYFAEYTDCGGSCNYSFEYYTFRKRDGHLLNGIVPEKELITLGFDNDFVMPFIGLGERGLLLGNHIMFGAISGLYEIDTIPYKEAKSYLSKEAQELIPND